MDSSVVVGSSVVVDSSVVVYIALGLAALDILTGQEQQCVLGSSVAVWAGHHTHAVLEAPSDRRKRILVGPFAVVLPCVIEHPSFGHNSTADLRSFVV